MKAYYSDEIMVIMKKEELQKLAECCNSAIIYRAKKYGKTNPYTKIAEDLWSELDWIDEKMPF